MLLQLSLRNGQHYTPCADGKVKEEPRYGSEISEDKRLGDSASLFDAAG